MRTGSRVRVGTSEAIRLFLFNKGKDKTSPKGGPHTKEATVSGKESPHTHTLKEKEKEGEDPLSSLDGKSNPFLILLVVFYFGECYDFHSPFNLKELTKQETKVNDRQPINSTVSKRVGKGMAKEEEKKCY